MKKRCSLLLQDSRPNEILLLLHKLCWLLFFFSVPSFILRIIIFDIS